MQKVDWREDCTEAAFVMSGLASTSKCNLIVEEEYTKFLDEIGTTGVPIEEFILKVVTKETILENPAPLYSCLGLPTDGYLSDSGSEFVP